MYYLKNASGVKKQQNPMADQVLLYHQQSMGDLEFDITTMRLKKSTHHISLKKYRIKLIGIII
ncbi:hypothetical protein IEQ34_010553 [Dendrobium chrysotoxum]|uniref:Uncharacterized protein n=1 Tax=Dendrobium chrysotoxum TaxID=161865 RepID=A0AAV7GXD6_DENCH|nr:hypothetical protein IEQ34_010553 [Dendrobium chrysotoxum]